jgi:hypothetical protein
MDLFDLEYPAAQQVLEYLEYLEYPEVQSDPSRYLRLEVLVYQ